jgi:hypothetical protein
MDSRGFSPGLLPGMAITTLSAPSESPLNKLFGGCSSLVLLFGSKQLPALKVKKCVDLFVFKIPEAVLISQFVDDFLKLRVVPQYLLLKSTKPSLISELPKILFHARIEDRVGFRSVKAAILRRKRVIVMIPAGYFDVCNTVDNCLVITAQCLIDIELDNVSSNVVNSWCIFKIGW